MNNENKKNKRKEDITTGREPSLYAQLPCEFKELLHQDALKDHNFWRAINYLYYMIDSETGVREKEESFLLMVQLTFGCPGIPCLDDECTRKTFWRRYDKQLYRIFGEVERIVNKKAGTIPEYRKGTCFLDDQETSLYQNMNVFLFWFYRYSRDDEKRTLAKNEILAASERNINYVLNLDNSTAQKILREERKSRKLLQDFRFGTFYHVFEPIIALVEVSPYDEETLEIFDEFYANLEKLSDVKARMAYLELMEDVKEMLLELYENQIDAISDQLEEVEEELVLLIKKRNTLKKRTRKVKETKYKKDDNLWDGELPF